MPHHTPGPGVAHNGMANRRPGEGSSKLWNGMSLSLRVLTTISYSHNLPVLNTTVKSALFSEFFIRFTPPKGNAGLDAAKLPLNYWCNLTPDSVRALLNDLHEFLRKCAKLEVALQCVGHLLQRALFVPR